MLGTYSSNFMSPGQPQQHTQQQQAEGQVQESQREQEQQTEQEQTHGKQQQQLDQQQEHEQEWRLEDEQEQEQEQEQGQGQGHDLTKQQQQGQRQPHEDTPRTCDICATRKRRCDCLRSRRYSTGIDKNKPHCHYRQRHAMKADSKSVVASRLRVTIDANRPVRPAQTSVDVAMVATSGSGASGLLGPVSLKRCRLSPSPATGLVGMQENAFLNDYFGCMGFLPLASASTARQAMVNIMLSGTNVQQRYGVDGVGAGSFAGQEQRGASQQGQEGGWGQLLAYHDRAGNSAKCIFWSAIALGALLQGRSLEFVAGYVELAQASLAECFDGTNVETARAYLAMAVLSRFLGDQIKDEEYMAFASSIVEGLPAELVPSDLENLLLLFRQESKVIYVGGRGSDAPVKRNTKEEDTVFHGVVHERDLCNILFGVDRRMHREIVENMKSDGFLPPLERQGEDTPNEAVDGESERFEEQVEWAMRGGIGEWAGGGVEVTLRSDFGASDWGRSQGPGTTPPLRAETLTCFGEVTPELERVSSVIERSNTCSGVGEIFYHSAMAYMHIIKGDRECAFQSVRVCTKVMEDFPGICRFRPHLVHSVLMTAASTMCPVIYEAVRKVYNSILPDNGPPAPPLEEWSGVSCICNHVFCRSFELSTNYVGFGPRPQSVPHECSPGVPTPPDHLFGLRAFSATEGTHGSSYCLSCGAHAAAPSSASVVGAVAGPEIVANETMLYSRTHAQVSSEHKVDVAAGGGQPSEVTAAIIPLVSLETQLLCDGGDPGGVGEEVGVGCRLRVQDQEPIAIDLTSGVSEDLSESQHYTTKDPAVAFIEPAVVPVGDSIWCNGGVGSEDELDRVCAVTATNDPASRGDLCVFNGEPEGAGLCLTEDESMDADAGLGLTEDYLMDAAEALMSSPPLDGELGGETVDLT